MRLTNRLPEDPLAAHLRSRHFVEVFFRGRRLEDAFMTEVAPGDVNDLRELAREAMQANEHDQVQALFRYMVRVYKYDEDRHGNPRKGRRVVDFVPRAEEGGTPPHGHAA